MLTPDSPAAAAISTSTGARPRARTCTDAPRGTEFGVTANAARPAESVTEVGEPFSPVPPTRSTGSPATGFPSESVTTATRAALVSPLRNAT